MWLIIMLVMLFVVVETLDYRIGNEEYNNRFSLNRTLDGKMAYYHDTKVSWLKFYMNIALPIMLLQYISNTYHAYQTSDVNSLEFIVPAILTLAAAINLSLFRSIDHIAYTTNLIVTSLCMLNICLHFNSYGIVGVAAWLLIFCSNTYYFFKKRELFLSTEKQLKIKYSLD